MSIEDGEARRFNKALSNGDEEIAKLIADLRETTTRLREELEAFCKGRDGIIEECAKVCDRAAEAAKKLLERSLLRANLKVPGDIRDHENAAAGEDGMMQMALDLAVEIRSLKRPVLQ